VEDDENDLYSNGENDNLNEGDADEIDSNANGQPEDSNDEDVLNEVATDEDDSKEPLQYPMPDFDINMNAFFPFANKIDAVLSTLLSYPDRPSKRFLEHLWKILKLLGIRDLPSLKHLQKIISNLPNKIKPMRTITPSGAVFHYVSPSALIASLFATPRIRKRMILYPDDDVHADMKCLVQGSKVKDDIELQTPMININGIRCFVNDFIGVRVDDSMSHFIVRGFFSRNRVLFIRTFSFCTESGTVDATSFFDISTLDHEVNLCQIFTIRRIA
jgi:hypothetical protein